MCIKITAQIYTDIDIYKSFKYYKCTQNHSTIKMICIVNKNFAQT